MQTQGFEFRVLPKKFQSSGEHADNNEFINTSPRLQKKLNKLRSDVAQRTSLGKLVRNWRSGPIGVKGKSLDDEGNLKRQKAKYYSTFSCSQTALNSQIQKTNDHALSARTELPKDTQVTSARSINSYFEGYLAPRPSLASEKSSFLPGYDDEFFDRLNLPGHFNTRGIYGQKANVTQLSLTRSKSDLSLNNLESFYRETGRQKTYLSFIPSNQTKHDYLSRKSDTPLQLPKILQPSFNHRRVINKLTSSKLDVIKIPREKSNLDKDTTSRKSEQKQINGDIELNKLKVKRVSVDATTQTDGELEGYEELEDIIENIYLKTDTNANTNNS